MRVSISGTAITGYDDTLVASDTEVDFPGNPAVYPDFPHGYTVTGSSPGRVLVQPAFGRNAAQTVASEIASDPTAPNAQVFDSELAADAAGDQPLDSDLTAIAALATTTFGRGLLDDATAAAARTSLGLGTAAITDSTAYASPVGAWAQSTAYAVNAVVTYGGGSWRCITAHTSTAQFQPGYFVQLDGKRLLRLPSVPVTRSADQTLAANVANAQIITAPSLGRYRRAKVRVSGSGQVAVAAYPLALDAPITMPDDNLVGSPHTSSCSSGAVNCLTSAGDLEIALPPTDLHDDFWGVVAAGAAGLSTIGGNGSSGYVQGAKSFASAFPLSGALSGQVTTDIAIGLALLGDDPTPLTSSYTRSITVNGSGHQISVLGKIGSKMYARNRTTDKWATSSTPLTAASWTDQTGPAFITQFGAASVLQIIGHGIYMIAVTNDGKLWRATLDDFSTWTEITVAAKPAGTTGRVDVLASDGTNLVYGNYNGAAAGVDGAHLFRSTNNGGAWTDVLTVAAARHVHAVYQDTVTATTFWATIGDDVAAGAGLYKSTDSGANWSLWSSSKYGIGMCFHTGVTNMVDRLIIEGDGTRKPWLFSFPRTAVTGAVTDALIYADTFPTDGYGTWGGTARASLITSTGNLVFASTAEGGAGNNAYRRNGLWAAKGPWFTTPVLLEEFTPSTPVTGDTRTLSTEPSWGKSYELTSTVFNGIYNFAIPAFAGQ